jgi:hypothetical protein
VSAIGELLVGSLYSSSFWTLQFQHHAGNQFFRIADGFDDYLDIHRRLTGLAGALAVNAVLAD